MEQIVREYESPDRRVGQIRFGHSLHEHRDPVDMKNRLPRELRARESAENLA